MARPKRPRRIESPPGFKGYLPIGKKENDNPVIINLEEYEAIRLSDFELLDHAEASSQMGVSRPTYTRIYESARRKVAEAFTMSRPIVFEGGKIYYDSEWYHCIACGSVFNDPNNDAEIERCALCGSENIEKHNGKILDSGQKVVCRCPECGFEKSSLSNVPCNEVICPECGHTMVDIP